MRWINLVFTVVLQRVRNVRFTYVVCERCLVADVAGRRGRRGHQDGARHLAVLGLEPILGQELLVFEPGISWDHVRRTVIVLAHLHQPGVQDVLLLVIVPQALMCGVAIVRPVGRGGFVARGVVPLWAFLALVLVQLVWRTPGGPVLGVRDGALHLLVERRVPLDVGHHVRVLGRRLLALVVDKVLAAGRRRRDSPADALLVAVNVLPHRRALLDLGTDVGVRHVVPVGRVVHLVGLAVGVCRDGRLVYERPLFVQVLDDVPGRHVRLVHHVGTEQQPLVLVVRQPCGVAHRSGVRQNPVIGHGRVVLGLRVAGPADGGIHVLRLSVGGKARAFGGVHHAVLVGAAPAACGLAGAGIQDVPLLVGTMAGRVQRVAGDPFGRHASVGAPLLVVLMVDGV